MLDETDRMIVRALSEGIPLTPAPYAGLAKSIGISEEEFIARLIRMRDAGTLRRVGAVLHHRKAGLKENALCVFDVEEGRLDAAGSAVSREAAVSHCYVRARADGWPYNFYVMVHARDRASCEREIRRIAAENALGEGRIFYSVREWKKASMKYF